MGKRKLNLHAFPLSFGLGLGLGYCQGDWVRQLSEGEREGDRSQCKLCICCSQAQGAKKWLITFNGAPTGNAAWGVGERSPQSAIKMKIKFALELFDDAKAMKKRKEASEWRYHLECALHKQVDQHRYYREGAKTFTKTLHSL